MTFNRIVEDAHELTRYIKNKLGKEKIIVLGHSWGSVIGTALVQAYPDDYIAYIGVGQIVNMTDSERVGYVAVLEAARSRQPMCPYKIWTVRRIICRAV